MGKLEDTYASALLEYAASTGDVEKRLADATRYSALLKNYLHNQHHTNDENHGTLTSFLDYLKKTGHEEEAGGILTRFSEMAHAAMGTIDVEVVSAVALSEKQLMDIQILLIKRSGKRIHLSHRVDPSLIAGIRLIADGIVMDTSVKNELADLKERFYRGVYFQNEHESV